MNNRFNLIALVCFFIAGASLFGYFLWHETMQTRLTDTEKRLLAETKAITMAGDYRFPPLSFTNIDGQYSGYEADLAAVLERWLGVPLDYHQMIWNEALEALDSGAIMAITGMRVTADRSKIYHYSEPYWQTSYSFIYPVGTDPDLVLNREQVTIAIQKRSATYDYFLDHFYHPGVNFIRVDQPVEAVSLIIEDEADMWFENYQVARYELLKAGTLDLVNFTIVPESVGQYALVLGPEYEHLVPIINKALRDLEKSGVLSDLDRKWFGLTDYREEPSLWDTNLPVFLFAIFTVLIIVLFWIQLLRLKVNQKTEELSKSEKKFKASFEGTHDAIYISTESGEMLDCNRNALVLFGYRDKDLFLSLRPEDLFPEKQPDNSESLRFYKGIVDLVMSSGNLIKFEMTHKRKDNSVFIGEVALKAYQLGDQKVLQSNISDITERRNIMSQLEFLSLHDQLTGLCNRNFFEMELERLKESNAYPITLISCDIDGLKLINDSLGHSAGDKMLAACADVLAGSLRISDKLARVGGDEFCVIMPHTDHKTGEEIARRIRTNISAYNKEHGDLPLGLSIGLATANHPDTLFKDLFRQADDQMYRDKLHRSASIKNRVVKSLLTALAERDNLTGGHAERLEELCLAVGEKIKLASQQLADLVLLAKVHDLGKVGIPDQILNKPGPLSPDEWAVMKQHSDIGFRIATSSPDLAGVADLILKHHEHWDGSGYPLGLEKEDIPIECRLLAIVDAFDAMTNERPYAPEKSREEALNEIRECAGNQFDPHLVKVFLSLFDDKNAGVSGNTAN